MQVNHKTLKLYKAIAWILLIAAIIHALLTVVGVEYGDHQYLSLKVAPAEKSMLSKEAIKQFDGAALYFKGDFVIKDYPWWKRTLLSRETMNSVCISLLCLLVIRIIQTLLNRSDLHQKVSRYILLGGLILLATIIIELIQQYFLNEEILFRTKGDFVLLKYEGGLLPNSMIAIILFIFSAVYARAFQSQREKGVISVSTHNP